MTFTAPTLDRAFPDICNPERATLEGWLRVPPETLCVKCAGLTATPASRRTGCPELSLLGLVRHMAEVERYWFQRRFGRAAPRPLYSR